MHPNSRRALLRWGAVVAISVGAVLVMLRPTPESLDETLPANPGDPALIAWTLTWDVHALVHEPLHPFDANIFWPNPDTLAYSDNLFALTPISGPIWAATGNAILALNITVLALLLLSMLATYALTRWLTARSDAAVLAAVAFTFTSYTMAHLGHPQLLTLGFFPLAFLVLFRALDERRTWLAIAWGAINLAFVLGALYYAEVWALCSVVVVVGYLIGRRFRPGPGIVRVLFVAGVTSLLALPALLPYFHLDQARPLRGDYGLNPEDLVSPAPGTLLYTGLATAADDRGGDRLEHSFFPGFLVFALAGVGVVALALSFRKRSPTYGPSRRRLFLLLLVVAGVVAAVVAVGPDFQGQPAPFRVFRRYFPGFEDIRVAARLAVPALLAGAVLAGFGLSVLIRRLRGSRATWVTAAAVGIVLLELAITLVRPVLPQNESRIAVYEELAERPDGAVVELPMADPRQGGTEWAFIEAPRMVYATRDWHPRVNGYSGNYPTTYINDVDIINDFPSRPARQHLARLDVRFVVLHTGSTSGYPQFTPAEAEAIVRQLPSGIEAEQFGDSWLLDLGD